MAGEEKQLTELEIGDFNWEVAKIANSISKLEGMAIEAKARFKQK